jgi:hypothetical protein
VAVGPGRRCPCLGCSVGDDGYRCPANAHDPPPIDGNPDRGRGPVAVGAGRGDVAVGFGFGFGGVGVGFGFLAATTRSVHAAADNQPFRTNCASSHVLTAPGATVAAAAVSA